jgi:hypothetical protein
MTRNEKMKMVRIGALAATGLFITALLVACAAMGGTDDAAAPDRMVDIRESEEADAASAVTASINYQGRLTDSGGNPLSGTYTMTFKLYETSTGGTALRTDTQSVTVTEGLFSTRINLGTSYFDGRALWLGITVGADPEMTPRQELRSVPYALSLRTGAVINGSVSGRILSVKNTYTGSMGDGIRAETFGDNSYSVWATANGDNSNGVMAQTDGGSSEAFYALTTGNYSPGVYAYTTGSNSEGIQAYSFGDGSGGIQTETRGKNAEGVYAHTYGDNSDGVYASTNGVESEGVIAYTYGDRSDGVWAHTTGYNAIGGVFKTENYSSPGIWAETIGDNSDGVNAYTYGDLSDGIYAHATGYNAMGALFKAEGDNSAGVWAKAFGNYSDGVYAISEKAHGVHGISNLPTDGVGIKGEGAYGVLGDGTHVGVYGKGKEAGGYFTTTAAGTAFWDQKPGVNIFTEYRYNPGVEIATTGDWSDGIYAMTSGADSNGIFASTTGSDSDGIIADTSGDDSNGIFAYTEGNFSDGFFAYTEGTASCGVHAHSEKYDAIYATTNRTDGNYGFRTYDNIYVGGKSNLIGPVDPIIVESFNADDKVTYAIGDVVCLAESGDVEPCSKADDTKVVGVVGPSVELEDGELAVVIMGHQGAKPDEEHVQVLEERLARAEAQKAELQVIAERADETERIENEITMLKSELEEAKSITRQVVRVKVDASYGAITAGDLLTSSSTTGHAMKAQPVDVGGVEIYRLGTIIGKALEPLESGTGMIEVFVTLQ